MGHLQAADPEPAAGSRRLVPGLRPPPLARRRARRLRVTSKGGDTERVYFQSGAAWLLPRLPRGRSSGPLFVTDLRPGPARAPAAADVRPMTGRVRISSRRMAELVVEHSGWPTRTYRKGQFVVALAVLDPTHLETGKASRTISEQPTAAGIDVIVDDRNDRPGVKFRDIDSSAFHTALRSARVTSLRTVELFHRVTRRCRLARRPTASSRW